MVTHFRLMNTLIVSMNLMNRVFQHHHDRFTVDFIDNILVNTMTKKEHTKHSEVCTAKVERDNCMLVSLNYLL